MCYNCILFHELEYVYVYSLCDVVGNTCNLFVFYRIDGVNLYSVQLPSLDPYWVFMMRQLIVVPSGVRPDECSLEVCTVDVCSTSVFI